MAVTQGKTVLELGALAYADLSDLDQLLIGDVSTPLLAKKTSIGNLRTLFGQVPDPDNPEDPGVALPTWLLEGKKGYWRVNIISAVEDALYYLIWYYDDGVDEWVVYPEEVTETRGTVGLSAGALIQDIQVVKDEDGIAQRTYRRFKIQTVTVTEKSSMSSEQNAYSIALLPATFVPAAPSIEDTVDSPYTESLSKYMIYAQSVILKIFAATGEEDYVSRYELQRSFQIPGPEKDWFTLPMHTLTIDPQLPSPSAVVYTDDSAAASPGDEFLYRARAIDTNGTPSEWSININFTVGDDTTAPDVPVLTITQVALGFKIIIAPPTQNGGDPAADVARWYIEGRKGAEAFANILGTTKYITSPEFSYNIPDANLTDQYQFKARAVDWSGNDSGFSTPAAATAPNQLSDAVMDNDWEQRSSDVETGVSDNSTLIGQNATAITLRATQVYVDGPTILGEITVNAGNIDLRVQYGEEISSFVLGVSGLKLTGASIEIAGATTFTAGWAAASNAETDINVLNTSNAPAVAGATDDTVADTKLLSTGGAYNSAGSGARVRIFPTAETALLVTDGARNVFAAFVGTTGSFTSGDVVMGDIAGQFIKFDAGTNKFFMDVESLEVTGFINIRTIGAGLKMNGIVCIDSGRGGTGFYNIVTEEGGVNVNHVNGSYMFLGVPVLGAQQPHITNASGTLGDVTAKFNVLLAYLDADAGHGILAGAP